MITDHYLDKWKHQPFGPLYPNQLPMITDAEIAEFRQLLERAREYDKKHNQPDCEMEEKKQKLLKLAEELGIKIDFL